jgi:esterase/lipase
MNNFLAILLIFLSTEISAGLNCNSVAEINKSKFKYQSDELTRWFLSSKKDIKAVALAFHGLNAKPSMMNPLITFLNKQGIHVLRGALRGHRGSLEEMEQVKRNDWQKDVKEIYCLARKRADELGLPLIFIGHSLGGLLFNDLAQSEKVKIDKAILFAPAFKIHWHLNFFSFIFKIKNSWSLPSRNLPQYRSQDVCTFAAYQALMDTIEEFRPQNYIPTLILMDPGDELVDFEAIKEQKMKNWRLIPVDTSMTTHEKIYRHLAFNQACFGDKEWNRIQKIMEDFLWAENGMK